MDDPMRGTYTAIVTPMDPRGDLDEDTLRRLVRRQLDGGVEGIVPCGTTGESVTLSRDEHLRVVELVARECDGAVPVIGGAGGSSTAAVRALARDVASAGASAVLSVVPAYNKPNQEGLFRHFSTVADACPVPVVLYNVPGRTARDMTAHTVLRLAEHGNIKAVKESSGSLSRIMELVAGCPEGFSVLSGDDDQALGTVALGGVGLVSVAANEAPGPVSDMVRLALAGRMAEARTIHYRLLPLMNVNFLDTNPIPVKAALSLMGLVQPGIRLPLVWASPELQARVGDALEAAGISTSEPRGGGSA